MHETDAILSVKPTCPPRLIQPSTIHVAAVVVVMTVDNRLLSTTHNNNIVIVSNAPLRVWQVGTSLFIIIIIVMRQLNYACSYSNIIIIIAFHNNIIIYTYNRRTIIMKLSRPVFHTHAIYLCNIIVKCRRNNYYFRVGKFRIINWSATKTKTR